MRLALTAVLVTLVGCRYQERDVLCDAVTVGCGGGEACVLSASGRASCVCGDTTSSERACVTGTSCSEGACVTNGAPTARIARASDGVLRVAANTSVTLSGRESTDPDGDVLTYAWSFEGACGAQGAALDASDLTVDTSLVTSGDCAVTLVVRDPLGERGDATATLTLRNIGAFVARSVGSCVVFDDASQDEQGTRTRPFCSLADGIDAARELSISEVSVAADVTYVVTSGLELDGVALVGGYDPATWQRNSVRTLIVAETNFAEPVLSLIGGAVIVDGIEVQRNAACGGACSVVSIGDAQTRLVNVAVRGNGQASAGRLVGVSTRTTSTTASVTMTTSVVNLMNARSLIGVELSGPFTASIENDSTIEVSVAAALAVGVDVTGRTRLTLDTTSVSATGADSAAFVAGLVDGRNDAVTGALGGCGTQVSCLGSTSLTLRNSVSIEGGKATSAYGGLLLGSSAVSITDSSLRVSESGTARGLLTMDVTGRMTVASTTIRADGIAAGAEDTVYAFADGVSDGSRVGNGSADLQFGPGVTLETRVPSGAEIENIVGMLLAGTRDSTFNGVEATVAGSNTSSIIAAAAVTYGTNNVTIAGGTFRITGVRGNGRIASYFDGCAAAGTDFGAAACATGVFKSNALDISGVFFDGELLGRTGASPVRRFCVLLGGTTDARFENNTIACTPEISGTASDLNVMLWTHNTTGVRLIHNHIDRSTRVSNGSQRTYVVGILDGRYPSLSATSQAGLGVLASASLTVDRNYVRLAYPSESNIRLAGVWFRGSRDQHYLTNTVIDVNNPESYGVVLEESSTVVALNTIRASKCAGTPPCSVAGTAVYVLYGSGHPSIVNGNLFTNELMNTPAQGTFVVDHVSGSGLGGIAALDLNQYGLSGDGASTPQIPPLWGVYQNNNAVPSTPVGLDTNESTFQSVNGAAIGPYYVSEVTFCGGSLLQPNPDLGSSFVSIDAVQPAGAPNQFHLTDINGSARSATGPFDCGASNRPLSCNL